FNLLIVPWSLARPLHTGGIARRPMRAQFAEALRETRILGGDDPALAGRDDLDWVKAEDGQVAEAAIADFGLELSRADRVGSVLDDLEAVIVRESADRPHVAGLSGEVNRRNDFRQPALTPRLGELRRQGFDVYHVSIRCRVDEIDLGAAKARGVGGGD